MMARAIVIAAWVLPALDIASLLPHKTLAYKGPDVLVHGKSVLPANGTAFCKP